MDLPGNAVMLLQQSSPNCEYLRKPPTDNWQQSSLYPLEYSRCPWLTVMAPPEREFSCGKLDT